MTIGGHGVGPELEGGAGAEVGGDRVVVRMTEPAVVGGAAKGSVAAGGDGAVVDDVPAGGDVGGVEVFLEDGGVPKGWKVPPSTTSMR